MHKNQFVIDKIKVHPLLHMANIVCDILGVDSNNFSKRDLKMLKDEPQINFIEAFESFVKIPEI